MSLSLHFFYSKRHIHIYCSDYSNRTRPSFETLVTFDIVITDSPFERYGANNFIFAPLWTDNYHLVDLCMV